MKDRLSEIIVKAIERCFDAHLLPPLEIPSILLDLPKNTAHGDFASNIAMVFSSQVKKPPREIAKRIVAHIIDKDGIIEKVEIAGPGFMNFFIRKDVWYETLETIHRLGENYGRSDIGQGRRLQVEFVSANPTGPLHIGHGRGAAVGDCLANVLGAVGYDVQKEYYINDVGTQIDMLGQSVFLRYKELLGKEVQLPPDYYQGDYIQDIAREIIDRHNGKYLDMNEKAVIPLFASWATRHILDTIKTDLADFGVDFESWYSENELFMNGAVHSTIEGLKAEGYIYEQDGAVWFTSTKFGDEKDRVVVRSTGDTTYFASDLAYHKNKFKRGFETVIDIWGADHHGYVPRILAGVQALGYRKDAVKVILVQLVNLLREGRPVAMSTRAGEFVTLREVLDEVGRDAARFIFLTKRADTPLDFDLEVAKKKTMDNPVYYVQYAHARICSVIKMALGGGITVPEYKHISPDILNLPDEIQLIKQMAIYPYIVESTAYHFEPQRIPYYLTQLASTFHGYYNKHRIVSDDLDLTHARLCLVAALKLVLENGLNLLGVSSPERM